MLVTTPNGQAVECASAYRNANTIRLLDGDGNEIYASSNDMRPYTIDGGAGGQGGSSGQPGNTSGRGIGGAGGLPNGGKGGDGGGSSFNPTKGDDGGKGIITLTFAA